MEKFFYRAALVPGAVALFLDGWALVDFLLHPLAGDATFSSALYRAANVLVLLPLTVLVGFLILRRVPGNVVGPLMLVWSGTLAYNSIRVDLGPAAFGLFYGYNIVFGWLGLMLMILHFPDGKIFPPRAARWVYYLIGIAVLSGGLTYLSQPHFMIPSRGANPYSLVGLQEHEQLITLVGVAIIFSPLLLICLTAPFTRYRKGTLLERQQIKWMALFGGALMVFSLIRLIAYPLLTGSDVMDPGAGLSGILFFLLTGLFPTLAIGVAVLRYRLWDIDRLIRRTLVYSTLTLLMTLIYFGSVVVLQTLFALLFSFTAGNLAVVLSTLAIAVLFAPLRRRVQRSIDRRFFRRKYDADQILARFAATARGVVTLDPLVAALLANVEETLQPEAMSVWLRAPRDPQKGSPGF